MIEVEPFARYAVSVGPDLTPATSAGDFDAILSMARAYADYLLPLALAHPAQWDGWERLRRA